MYSHLALKNWSQVTFWLCLSQLIPKCHVHFIGVSCKQTVQFHGSQVARCALRSWNHVANHENPSHPLLQLCCTDSQVSCCKSVILVLLQPQNGSNRFLILCKSQKHDNNFYNDSSSISFFFFFGQNVRLKPFCINFKVGNYWAMFFVIDLSLWLAVWRLESESWAQLHHCLWINAVLWTEHISTRCFISGYSWEVSFTSLRIFQYTVVGDGID